MFKIFKNVIETGRFDLSDMLEKIESNWVQGKLTDAEKTELITLAQGFATPEQSVDLMKKIMELEREVKAIKREIDSLKNSSESNTQTEEYPEYISGKWYYNGDKITFDGKKYVCTAPDGVVCTWNPIEYPAYWEMV